MNFAKVAAALAAGAILASCTGQGTVPTQSQGSNIPVVGSARSIAESNHWVPRYLNVKPTGVEYNVLKAHPAALTSVPYYTRSIVSPLDNNTYTYSIVGKDPTTSNTTTTVSY